MVSVSVSNIGYTIPEFLSLYTLDFEPRYRYNLIGARPVPPYFGVSNLSIDQVVLFFILFFVCSITFREEPIFAAVSFS